MTKITNLLKKAGKAYLKASSESSAWLITGSCYIFTKDHVGGVKK